MAKVNNASRFRDAERLRDNRDSVDLLFKVLQQDEGYAFCLIHHKGRWLRVVNNTVIENAEVLELLRGFNDHLNIILAIYPKSEE